MEQFSASLSAATATENGNPGGGVFRCTATTSGTTSVNMLAAALAASQQQQQQHHQQQQQQANGLNTPTCSSSNTAIPSQSSAFALLQRSCESSLLFHQQQHQQQQQKQQNSLSNAAGNLFLNNSAKNPIPMTSFSNNGAGGDSYDPHTAIADSNMNNATSVTANNAAAALLAKIQHFIDPPKMVGPLGDSSNGTGTAAVHPFLLSSQLFASAKLPNFSVLQQQQQQHQLHQQLSAAEHHGHNNNSVSDFEHRQLQLESTLRAALEPHMLSAAVLSGAHAAAAAGGLSSMEIGKEATSSADTNPVRRIRRRRPKSPHSMKSVNACVEQTATPDDPIINSPPSLVRLPTEGALDEFAKFDSNNLDMNGADQKGHYKECLVCGDHATGYNFNVITCESCKAFFRRNALRPKEFKCPYNNECNITAVTRRFCQRCRLLKCFNVGMKKEWILNDDQLKRRKNSRLNNNKSRTFDNGGENYMSPAPSSASQRTTPTPSSTPCTNAFLMSPPGAAAAAATALALVKRDNATRAGGNFFISPSMRLSTDLPIISPQSMQSLQNSIVPLTPELPSTTTNINAILPQIESGEDQYNPNIMQIQPSINSINSAFSSQITTTSAIGTQLSATARDYSATAAFSALPSLSAAQPAVAARVIGEHSTYPSVEALIHKGETKIALSIEDYQRLISSSSAASMTAASMVSGALSSTTSSASSALSTEMAEPRAIHATPAADELEPMDVSSTSDIGVVTAVSSSASSTSTSSAFGVTPKSEPIIDFMCGVPMSDTMMSPCSSSIYFHSPEALAAIREKHIQMVATIEDEYYKGINEQLPPMPIEKPKRGLEMMLVDVRYRLNSYEAYEIQMVRQAFRHMDDRINEFNKVNVMVESNGTIRQPRDVLNIIDLVMRRHVKMAKEIRLFSRLSSEGRVHLLKISMLNMMTVRGMMRLDLKKQNFVSDALGDMKVSAEVFDKFKDKEQGQKFFRLRSLIEDAVVEDPMAMNLFIIVVLFDLSNALHDDRDRCIGKQGREHYTNLLKRHLESQHGDKAKRYFDSLPAFLAEVYKVGENAPYSFTGIVKQKDIEPLIKEFFKFTPENGTNKNSLNDGGGNGGTFSNITAADDEPISVVDEADEADVSPSVDVASATTITDTSVKEAPRVAEHIFNEKPIGRKGNAIRFKVEVQTID